MTEYITYLPKLLEIVALIAFITFANGGTDEGEHEQEHQHNGGVDEEFNHSQSAFPKSSFSA